MCGMTRVWHHRQKQLKADSGTVPICTLETHPPHPMFGRRQEARLSPLSVRCGLLTLHYTLLPASFGPQGLGCLLAQAQVMSGGTERKDG